MKIILMVGYDEFENKKKIAENHPDYLFVSTASIINTNSADVVMESTKMVDAIMFLNSDSGTRLAYEVAAVMFKKPIVTEEMLKRAEREMAEGMVMKELSDTAKQIIVDTMRNPL
jgi:hypothetical protein